MKNDTSNLEASEFLSPADVAVLLNISLRSVYNLKHRPDFPAAFKLNRITRFRKSEILDWLNDCRESTLKKNEP